MGPHVRPSPDWPALPIVSPEEARRSDREKYGGLFYLGVGGLAVLLALIAWFGYGAWAMRGVWSNIYVLHDRRRSDVERIQAAYALSLDHNVTPRQLWDIALRRDLPPLARYVIAEALPAGAIDSGPRAYGLSIARSEGWPDWLRLLLLRPMALAAAAGRPVPCGPLDELARHPDPAIALWTAFVRASACDDADARASLRRAAATPGARQELARLLLDALVARGPDRLRDLDQATRWLRRHQPEAARIWAGWHEERGRLVPSSAPELR